MYIYVPMSLRVPHNVYLYCTGDVTVLAYFPGEIVWYDFYTLKRLPSGGNKYGKITLDAPIDYIPVSCNQKLNYAWILTHN